MRALYRGDVSVRNRVLCASMVLAFFILPSVSEAETAVPTGALNSNQHWTKVGSPYVISGPVQLGAFRSLTVDAGVVVKFAPGAYFTADGSSPVQILGSAEEPVYFTSLKDDTVGGDTNGDGDASSPAPGDWGYFSTGANSANHDDSISHLKVRYGGGVAFNFSVNVFPAGSAPSLVVVFNWYSGSPGVLYEISNIEVTNSPVGLYLHVGKNHTVRIRNSSFANNSVYGVYKGLWVQNFADNSGVLDVAENWWGDPSGPKHSTNPEGFGSELFLTTRGTFSPWLTENPFAVPDPEPEECCSSVLFLPGIMGSRLFEGDTKRWEPGDEADVQALYLSASGESINENIEATEVIDEVSVTGGNIYESLLLDLESLDAREEIEEYKTYPYDWRLSLPDLLADGELENVVHDLAQDSQTERVTIIAHSNGGILAKALINELGPEASELIDKLILVGVPQLGTPQAIGALLHGFDTGLPFDWLPLVLTPERARDFLTNAPMAYQLLPHQDYFSNVGAGIGTPVISFEDGEATQMFIDAYDSVIGNGSELHEFLSGAEGRVMPTYSDLENPAIGNESLLNNAEILMNSVGSSWQPPEGVEVHQIAGIGENTLAGITYKSVTECLNAVTLGSGYPICLEYGQKLSYTPEEVLDGDGTVVVPSALAMSDSDENVKRWWVDLEGYNELVFSLSLPEFLRTNHGNFLEIDELRSFIINNLLVGSTDVLPTYISSSPLIPEGSGLRFILHSPLSLSVNSADGEISETASTIQGATFKRYGEVQVAMVPAGVSPTLALNGVSDGSFTLDIEEYASGVLVSVTSFSGIPSLAETNASMSFPDGTIQNAGNLDVDYDGDGETDITLESEVGETVTLDDPSLDELLTILATKIQSLDIEEKLKNKLLKKLENLEKKILKKKEKNTKIFDRLEFFIDKKTTIGNLASEDAEAILALLEELEVSSDMLVFNIDTLTILKSNIANLDIKSSLKNNLLKRVEKLEEKVALTNALAHLSTRIMKKGEKGDISEADVNQLLELLGKIEVIV